MYKAAKNPEFLGYRGNPFPGWYPPDCPKHLLRSQSKTASVKMKMLVFGDLKGDLKRA